MQMLGTSLHSWLAQVISFFIHSCLCSLCLFSSMSLFAQPWTYGWQHAGANITSSKAAARQAPGSLPAYVKRHFISVLDGDPIWPMPEVCTKCRSPWFCTCPKDKDDLAVHNVRERSPPPPPPGMVEILCMRMPLKEAEAPPHRRHEVREARRRREVASSSEVASKRPRYHHTPQGSSGPMEVAVSATMEGQKEWEAVKKVLPPKTLLLERTKPMFEELLTDEHIKVWLPSSTHYIQHCHRVVALIPRDYRFKIGITVDPSARYYESHYAYSKSRSQQRDQMRYNSMVVIYTHHSREVIAMMEHALITHFRIHSPHQCANRKIDFDNHIRFDESGSSDNEHSPGPHSVYVCYGPRL